MRAESVTNSATTGSTLGKSWEGVFQAVTREPGDRSARVALAGLMGLAGCETDFV